MKILIILIITYVITTAIFTFGAKQGFEGLITSRINQLEMIK